MKKIILIFAVTMLLTGCSEQKNISETPPEIINETEAPTEPVFTEYNAEEFKVIEIKSQRDENTAPPVAVEAHSLDEIDIPDEMPVCRSVENRDEYFSIYNPENYDATDEERRKEYDERCDSAAEPAVRCTALNGTELYLLMDYDYAFHHDMDTHCFDILKHDLEKGTTETICTYNSKEDTKSYYIMNYCKGSLYLLGQHFDVADIKRLNEETGELEELPSVKMPEGESYGEFLLHTEDSENLTVIFDSSQGNSYYYSYNEAENKWDELYSRCSKSSEGPLFFGTYVEGSPENIDGDRLVWGKDDNNETYAQCSRFRLNTGIKGAKLAAYHDDRVTFIIPDKIKSFICTFDLDKMEMYRSELMGDGDEYQIFAIDQNLVILHWGAGISIGKHLFYYIPDLGIKFDLGGFGQLSPIYSNGETIVAFEPLITDENSGVYDPEQFTIFKVRG